MGLGFSASLASLESILKISLYKIETKRFRQCGLLGNSIKPPRANNNAIFIKIVKGIVFYKIKPEFVRF